MRRLAGILFVVAMAFVSAGTARTADFPEKWLFYTADLSKPEQVDRSVAMMKEAKEAGCTHVLFNEPITTDVMSPTPEYRAAARRIVDAAKAQGIELVMNVFSIGYSGKYIVRDANLAAGLPVKDVPFVVKDGMAWPDPSTAPSLANPGFEEFAGEKLTGWEIESSGGGISIDKSTKHSGAASLKVADIAQARDTGRRRWSGPQALAKQRFSVKPFQYYRVTVWIKTENLKADPEGYINVSAVDGTRQLKYTNLTVKPTEDWTQHETVFNTLESTDVEFSVGLSSYGGGTAWFDDLKIEPAGLLNVVVREATPFKVMSADGKMTYAVGRDYDGVRPSTANEIYKHVAVARPLLLPLTTRIKDGDRLLVSYFHTVLIYADQLGCSLEDPAVFEMMDRNMKNAAEIWGTKDYMMNYDEIRIGGWENQPGGAHLKPGELLAQHVAKAVQIARKYVPDATLYTWSDMFSSRGNAAPFERRHAYYYLVNGNWDGSWEGLPKDVVILSWNGGAAGLQWYAERGHKQIIAGYYDSDPKRSIDRWMSASKGVTCIIGFMYTTWKEDYSRMNEFFTYLKEYKYPDVESTPR